MNTLKSNQIKSEAIPEAIKEIEENYFEFAQAVAIKNEWAIGDAIEAIATHIVINDEDYIVDEQVNQAAANLGKIGGRSKSTAKQQASRENGKKGGRPKTKKPS